MAWIITYIDGIHCVKLGIYIYIVMLGNYIAVSVVSNCQKRTLWYKKNLSLIKCMNYVTFFSLL